MQIPVAVGTEDPPQTSSFLDERIFSAVGESTDYDSTDVHNTKVRTQMQTRYRPTRNHPMTLSVDTA